MALRVRDHLGRPVELAGAPRRIVSLVPSITETLVALGALERLVGRTDFCIHPARELEGVATVGGTKTPDLERVRALSPDLVLANQEENREAHVAELARTGAVFVTDVRTIAGARAWVSELSALLRGEPPPSHVERRAERSGKRACALVWRRPLVAVGEDTYAADVLAAAGVANVFDGSAGRYPRLESVEALARLRPELVVLPSEPYAWTGEEGRELERELAGHGLEVGCVHVPGEALTWWGSRSERAAREITEAIR
jgi:ABC-type Fe3+-hydroxamate transport system substrate-binding protein